MHSSSMHMPGALPLLSLNGGPLQLVHLSGHTADLGHHLSTLLVPAAVSHPSTYSAVTTWIAARHGERNDAVLLKSTEA